MDPSEREKYQAAIHGDREAFEMIIRTHSRTLFAIAYGVLQSREDLSLLIVIHQDDFGSVEISRRFHSGPEIKTVQAGNGDERIALGLEVLRELMVGAGLLRRQAKMVATTQSQRWN